MLKNLLTLLAISPIISNQVTSPYLSINQFVIFNNITDINLSLDNPQTSRGQYVFYCEINGDEDTINLLNDNKGLYFELGSYSYYLKDFDDNFITGNVNQFITWSDYFNSNTLGLNFENLRNDYTNAWIENINFQDFFYWLQSLDNFGFDISEFGFSTDLYVHIHTDWDVPPHYIDNDEFIHVFKAMSYYYDVSIGLNNYTYSPYANYNFEFTGYANASIGDYGPLVSIQGSESGTFHPTSNQLSNGRLIIRITNLSNLDYMSQYVLEDYPFYETLQLYLSDSVDVYSLENQINSLTVENARLREIISAYESGNTMQNLLWTVAGTPWESFKNIWNVNVLGLNISGFVTGLITALVIIWIVKKLWK